MTPTGDHLGDLLSAVADGELDAAGATAARAHLGRCPTCRAELAATERARALVRGLPFVDPPISLVAGPPRGTGRLVGMVAGVAAGVALLLLPGVREEEPDPSVGRLVEVHATSAVNEDPVSQLTPALLPVSVP